MPAGKVTKADPWPSGIAQKWDTQIYTHANCSYLIQGLRLEARLLLINHGQG